MNQSPFGLPPFDPSKMDPKLLMELSQLIQQLPPEQLNRMQTLMHNMMAGHDVRKEMEEFEKNLPPAFRIRMATLMANHAGSIATASQSSPHTGGSSPMEVLSIENQPEPSTDANMNIKEARLTVLRAVADGQMTPEEAEKFLFNAS